MAATMPAAGLMAAGHGRVDGGVERMGSGSSRVAPGHGHRSRHAMNGGRLSTPHTRGGRVTLHAFRDSDRGPTRWTSPPRDPARNGEHKTDHTTTPRAALRELSGTNDSEQTRPISMPNLFIPPKKAKRGEQQSSVFERSGGFVYIRNFFSPHDYELIREECALLRNEVGSERRACARQRLGVMINESHLVHRAFMNQNVAHRLGQLTGQVLQPADVPVEYRIYPQGSCMDWHQDVALYTTPQYELVFTLENTSDSQTQWRDADGRRRGGWTEPNSVIMVRAENVVHRVTPITTGERSIVKFVYTTTLEKTNEFYDNLNTYER